jgi:uncharacterized damage-inducible protein DinB
MGKDYQKGDITMQLFYMEYLRNLEELHEDLLRTVKDLPQEALDWSPVSGGNSFNVIITHVAGAEKYWLGDVIAGVPSGRDRNSEFKVKQLNYDELDSRLKSALEYADGVLESLNLNEFETTRILPRDNSEITVAWALEHTLKHTAIHLGHAQITRQLWMEQKRA